MNAPRPSRLRSLLAGACAAAAFGALGLGPAASTASAAISCRMNVATQLSSAYAASFTSTMDVRVRSREGRPLRGVRVQLYTFGGERLGVGVVKRTVRRFGAVDVRLRLSAPMQAGGLTLVVSEERRAPCGTPKKTRVVRLRGCATTLPVRAVTLPGGRAADYEQWLTVPMEPTGARTLTNVLSQVFTFDGTLVGTAQLARLFGRADLDHALGRPLAPGGYSLVVTAQVAGQPGSCGRVSRSFPLTFA
ncbi:hypothetical protein [Conexibacter sp. SYSU D00693]|uniref:hypothetical protein n=1 Tax=Conexibacter sp. SYSU D00693 TaxID=2812560 RepID=UPI00196AD42D|nr:hypothetical protein [Conexibacter sp. SYSU D00693]